MVKRSRTFNVADVQEQEFGVVASTSYSSSSNGNGTLDSAAFLSSSLGSTVANSSNSNSRTLPNPKKKSSNKDKGPSKTSRNGVGGGAILLSAGDAAEQVRS